MNLAGPFLETLRAQGKAVAIREPGGHAATYADVYAQVAAFQHYLRECGFRFGDSVVIQVPNGNAFAVATIAVLSLGGIAVLCEPGLGDEIYLGRLNAACPKWVFVHPIIRRVNWIPGARALLRRRELHVPPLMPRSLGLNEIVVSNKFFERLTANSKREAVVEDVDARHDAIIIFTGGTTSAPKGVRLSHGALRHYLDNIAGIARSLDINTFLADTPQQVLYGLNLGKEVFVTKGRTRRRAAYVRSLIERGMIDAYFGSPFLWMEMLDQAGAHRIRLPASLKAVLLGGAPVTPEFLAALREWLHPNTTVLAIYGLTEAGPVAVASAEDKIDWNQGGAFVGRCMPGTSAEAEGGGVGAIIGPSNA
ncbi:MAG: AMP-binding protein, partial [Candidatus Hydrogenedentota bacterium]